MSVKQLYPLAIFAIIGCASANASGDTPRGGTQARKSDLLTQTDLVSAHADVNSAYDAVVRLRPNWLAVHGVTSTGGSAASTGAAIVFVDGQRYGGTTTLRNIPAFNVVSMRYYDITQAGARFGIQGGAGGVIEVVTR